MVNSCCVLTCKNKKAKDPNARFYGFPKIGTQLGPVPQNLLKSRREAWMIAINRNLPEDRLKHLRVCHKHFKSGAPSHFSDVNDVDWIPNRELGELPRKLTNKLKRIQRFVSRNYSAPSKQPEMNEVQSSVSDIANVIVKPVNRQKLQPISEEMLQKLLSDDLVAYKTEKEKKNVKEESIYDDFVLENVIEEVTYSHVQIVKLPEGVGVQTDMDFKEIDNIRKENEALKLELLARNAEVYRLRDEVEKLSWNPKAFENQNEKVTYFTGLPKLEMLMSILENLNPSLNRAGAKKLTNFQKLLLTFMKLRMNSSFRSLGYKFDVSIGQVTELFKRVIISMSDTYGSKIRWPNRDSFTSGVPTTFESTLKGKIAIIVELFTLPVGRYYTTKSDEDARADFKEEGSVTYLVAVSPQGNIIFVSGGWDGQAVESYIIENCNVLDNLLPGDIVISKRGQIFYEVSSPQDGNSSDVVSLKKITPIPFIRHDCVKAVSFIQKRFSIIKEPIPISLIKTTHNGRSLFDLIVCISCIFNHMCDSPVIS